MNYTIVKKSSISNLENEVNHHLLQGYKIIGAAQAVSTSKDEIFYIQTLLKE